MSSNGLETTSQMDPLEDVSENSAALAQLLERLCTPASDVQELAVLLRRINPLLLTSQDIVAAVLRLRTLARVVPKVVRPHAIDLCGTGGDKKSTPNISTLAALTVASCGIDVAKHGGRSASGNFGSADLIAALGIPDILSPQLSQEDLRALHFAFYFAPSFLPALARVAPIRSEIGRPTALNVILPLLNPARPAFHLMGVYDSRLLYPVAFALQQLGIRRALVVSGAEGYDEMTTTGETRTMEVTASAITENVVVPEDCNVSRVEAASLRCDTPAQSLAAAILTVTGVPTPILYMVALNAVHALYVSGHVDSAARGVSLALDTLREGRVYKLVTALRSIRYPTKRMSLR